MIEEIQQEVKCSICVEDFMVPVTIHCGHTFCRECLKKSPIKECPLCRKPIISLVQNLQENRTISEIIDMIRRKDSNKYQTDDDLDSNGVCSVEREFMENVPLFHTTTRTLLLPYSRTRLVFKSSSINMSQTLRNVVVKQNLTNSKFCVLGSISNITPSLNILYEFQGIFQGYCLFQLQKVQTINNEGQMLELCQGMALKEKTAIRIQDFNAFFDIYDRISEEYKQPMSEVIDPHTLSFRSNNIAILYVIYRLIAISDDEKIQVLSTFNDQIRLSRLKKYFSNISIEDAIRSPSTVFKFPVPGNSSSMYIFGLIIFLLVIWKFGN